MTENVKTANTDVATQADLISQIQTALEGKAAVTPTVDTCTVTITISSGDYLMWNFTRFVNGQFKDCESNYYGYSGDAYTFTNVVCGSAFTLSYSASKTPTVSGATRKSSMSYGDSYIITALADETVTITL